MFWGFLPDKFAPHLGKRENKRVPVFTEWLCCRYCKTCVWQLANGWVAVWLWLFNWWARRFPVYSHWSVSKLISCSMFKLSMFIHYLDKDLCRNTGVLPSFSQSLQLGRFLDVRTVSYFISKICFPKLKYFFLPILRYFIDRFRGSSKCEEMSEIENLFRETC